MRCLLLVLSVALGVSNARWMLRERRSDQPKDTSFVGEATNELATAIFQGYIDDDKNIAFSPLGYSAILAILAEGARGETRQQLVTALHLPSDPNHTRKTYRHIMERLKNTHNYGFNMPELKNYFYIYKNFTVNEDYKKILEDYYLTDVRSVERYTGEHNFKPNNPDDVVEFTVEITDPPPTEDGDKNTEVLDLLPSPKSSYKTKDVELLSKTKEVKKPEVLELLPTLKSEEKLISFAVEDKPDKIDISGLDYKPAKNIKEKIKLAKNSPKTENIGDEEETMVAVEARNQPRTLNVLSEKNDITSSISVNSVGNKFSKTSPSQSLMIIFNGMYFRGSWKQPFEKVEPGVFYKSNKEKKSVMMMKTKGTFKTGLLPELDSEAIELPYDGDRYSLLLLVPRSREGLTRLTADLPASPLSDIQDSLRDEELQISLPTFYLETTTKLISALAKFGVSSIFSRDADFSGVSEAEGLFVQELVQHVAVRVDNADSSVSQISSGNPSIELLKTLPVSEAKPRRQFKVEHPFIFFIIDRLDKLIVAAGKINDPEQPTPFDI